MLMAAAAGSAGAAMFRLGTPFRLVVAALLALAAVIPFGLRAFAPFLLSLTGPLSAATLLLLAELVAVRASRKKSFAPSVAFLSGVLACGVVLYPGTLGWGPADLYDLGYRGYAVPSLMAVLASIGWVARSRDLPCWLVLAALLHAGNVYGTGNLWNYLIDPVAVLIAGLWLVAILIRRWRARPGE